MKKREIANFLFMFCICTVCALLCSCDMGCSHTYDKNVVSATCLEDGYTEYTCSRCGDTYREAIPKLGHTPGAEATPDTAQSCTVCGAIIKDKLGYTAYSGTELAINYKYGYAQAFTETPIDSQYHGKYEDYVLYYNDSSMMNDKPLRLSIPIQEFYTHSICSVGAVKQTDGKSYTTDSGFKLNFNFSRLEIPAGSPQTVWEGGLKTALKGVPDSMLVAVATYPAEDKFYNTIYEVIDFSDSSIQIVRTTENGEEIVKDISSVSAWEGMLHSNGDVTDANGALFYTPGRYKITFKYSLAWFATPSSKVYNQKNPNGVYPYGFVGYQYDTFYVTVTDAACGVLVPHDDDVPADGFFCQLRADVIKKKQPFMSVPNEKMTLNFGNDVALYVRAKVDALDGQFFYDHGALESFTLTVSYYDMATDRYQVFETMDLLPSLKQANVTGEEMKVAIVKDPLLRGKSCRFTVSYSYRDPATGAVVTESQKYDYAIDWK